MKFKQLLQPALVLLAFSACTTFKEYDKETKTMREGSADYLVVKNDGARLTGSTFKIGRDKLGKKPAFIIDGNNILQDEARAYQDKVAFYEKTDNGSWAKLLRKGKINLYYFDTQDVMGYHQGAGGSQMADTQANDHFCFRKGEGVPKELTTKQIADLLADNPAALSKFTGYWKPTDKKLPKGYALHKIIDVIDLYNR